MYDLSTVTVKDGAKALLTGTGGSSVEQGDFRVNSMTLVDGATLPEEAGTLYFAISDTSGWAGDYSYLVLEYNAE